MSDKYTAEQAIDPFDVLHGRKDATLVDVCRAWIAEKNAQAAQMMRAREVGGAVSDAEVQALTDTFYRKYRHLSGAHTKLIDSYAQEAMRAALESFTACRAAVPDGWMDVVRAVISALDSASGDSDPNIDPKMTDDEIRDEYPEIWAMQQLSGLLAAAPEVPK